MDQNAHSFPLPAIGMTLCGISVGGICTAMQVPQAKLAVDCGVLTPVGLRMPVLALTHVHLDHAGAIAPYLATRRLLRMTPAIIYAPAESVTALRSIVRLWAQLQGRPFEVEILPVTAGIQIDLGRKLSLRPFTTRHTIPSVGYTLLRKKQILLPVHAGRTGVEIAALRARGEQVSESKSEPLITFTGDTTPCALANDPVARKARVIVSELSFIGEAGSRAGVDAAERGRHTHIDGLIEHLDALECETLVLMHSSRKHTVKEIQAVLAARLPAQWREKTILFHHQDRKV